MGAFNIVFIGHMAIDEVRHYDGKVSINPGSAVLCGALAATNIGSKVAVVTRMSSRDTNILTALFDAGVEVSVVPTPETTYIQVIHPSENMDVRELNQVHNAGYFQLDDIPEISADIIHLAGITDQEFSLDFIRGLKSRHVRLSADMQSFVRQVDLETGKIYFNDVKEKRAIIEMLDFVKLDIVEAKILTKTDDLELAARKIAAWGGGEVVITNSDGVLGLVNGVSYFSRFTNRSVIGRTGRGDTTFGAYLAWRKDHSFQESLDFAAALVSIKMEQNGPFSGDLSMVLSRMRK
jgi:sugar/nucleoside kinase (ribokinase family)